MLSSFADVCVEFVNVLFLYVLMVASRASACMGLASAIAGLYFGAQARDQIVLDMLGLQDCKKLPVNHFSSGLRQRLPCSSQQIISPA